MVSVPGETRLLGALTLQLFPVAGGLLAAPPQAVSRAVARRADAVRIAFMLFSLTSLNWRSERPAANMLVVRTARGEAQVGGDHLEAVAAAAAPDSRARVHV